MSIKKNMAKLKKGRALVQQGQQAAHMAKQAAGMLGGLGGTGTPRLPVQGIAGPIAAGGQGLVERVAGGQHAASKALQKASQLLGGGGGTAPSGLQFTLTAGGLPPETFVVTDFSLTEGFSQPFHLTVGLASADPAIDFPAVLDRSATLTILQEGVEQRSITGMVARFEQGNTGLHQTTYQMSIYPDLWRTTLRQNSRIFQQLDIAAILTTLLKEHGIRDVVFSLRHPHPAREFCVQYQESDFTFLQRLTAEEGIFYFFECGNGRNTLVFADDAGSVPPGIVLPYQPGEGSTTGTPSVGSFTCSAQVRPAQVQLKDYTFKNPAWPAEFSQQMKEDTLQLRYYEHYDYPGRFKDEAHGEAFTRYRLEALRSDAVTGQGSGQAIAVQPGKLFTLDNHPRADLNQPWQVVSASHAGSQPQARETASSDSGTTLHSQFSFIRHNQHWRPAPRTKPTIDGPQIAKVVGPAGEEIFCDQYGRIRLQFPWDRYGKSDDQSSCWIRVSQPWAGQGWGMLAIPRIGQEVVVDFLHGDPDQPIVTGRTYHASNIPPGALPGSKTQMAFRSKTHKGEGYNELLFEDAKGSEKLALHAQKDMHTTVKNDQSLVVEAGDRTLTLQTGNETKKIEQGSLSETVCLTRSTAANTIQVKAEAGKGGAGTQLYEAQDDITLRVGSGTIQMTKSNIKISFEGASIELNGSGVTVLGGQINLNK
ncbi:type VI secretion system tip protein VgrG [Xenorhabdus sp. XENO-1]|uniref:type VI secretion system Vgr family protein n=1 Tax=Xenorhabdus bovienii TaxID=40576 RepID=UPI0020CA3194|nr:type VI secretion system tip protein VgrG [Xenorhabdus bovienii]MCP9266526.1 type VI secretion system tip protein VgrG [Xenorhabdus bovienii subsp. africana]